MSKLWITLLVALTLIGVPTIAQDDAESLCFENGGFIDSETGQCAVNISLNISNDYPIEYMDIPFVMEQLDSIYDSEVQTFISAFSSDAGIYPTYGGWELDMNYHEARYSETIFSVIINEYQYTGGAHGLAFQYALTFDTEAETVLTLDNIFTDVDAGLAVVAPLAVTKISDEFVDYTDDDWLAQGTDPTNRDNYGVWYLTADGIVFYFGQYQIAAYAAGTQEVLITWDELSGVLEPAFVPET